MGIKHFQQLNITGDQRNQVAFSAAFQFCRGQRPEFSKHKIPDPGQEPECYVMVAGLFAIPEHPPQHSTETHDPQQGGPAFKQCHSRQDRYQDGSQKSGNTQKNCQDHPAGHGPDLTNQPAQDRQWFHADSFP